MNTTRPLTTLLRNAQVVFPERTQRTDLLIIDGKVAALRTVVLERRQAADSYRASTATSVAELERIAQVSYDAGERSILELVDAYRNSGSTRLRQVALDAAVRHAEIELELVSGWEIR